MFSEGYPGDAAGVIIKSDVISQDIISELNSLVDDTIKTNTGSPVMEKITEEVFRFLKDKSLECPSEAVHSHVKGKRKQKACKLGMRKADATEEKKSSMKTAKDVVNRILWDESLPVHQFTIGYLDRFRGIIEKSFSEFSWEDLASVDFDVFAIPQHRIQYFKYRDVIVWEKKNRTDNVFGSTGSGLSIHDVIGHYDDYYSRLLKPCKVDSASAEDVTEGNDNLQCVYVRREDRRDVLDRTDEECTEEGWAEDKGNIWQEKQQPTHFVCVRVTDPEIRANVAQVQQDIVDKKPMLRSHCIPPEVLHVTLCTLQMTCAEQIASACHCLRILQTNCRNMGELAASMTIEGVDSFSDRVIYAKVNPDEYCTNIIKELTTMLHDVVPKEKLLSGFIPHLTLMKLSQGAGRTQKTETFSQEDFDSFQSFYFGKQNVNALYLCEINSQRSEDGFYLTQMTIPLE